MRALLFYTLLMITPCLSAAEEINSILHQEEMSAINQANDRLIRLNKQISLFLDERQTNLKENKAFLKEVGEWKKALKEDAAFRKNLKKLQEEFLVFRDRLSEVVASNYGPCSYSRSLRSMSILHLTEWYASHIEDMIFPEHLDNKKTADCLEVMHEDANR